jgi:hypothetical protein
MPNNGTTLYWRIKAGNASGWSGYSATWSLVSGTLPIPAAPTLLTPANGSTVNGTVVNFTWTAPTGATQYWFQISTNSSFTSLLLDQNIGNYVSGNVSNMPNNGTTLYWRIKAGNASGWSSYSGYWSFKNGTATVPQAPTLFLPLNTSTVTTQPILFDWSDVTGAIEYWVQISTNSGFTSLVYDASTGTTSQISLQGFTIGTTYYWHIKAKNSVGWGSYSSFWSVNLSNTAAPPTLYISPIAVSISKTQSSDILIKNIGTGILNWSITSLPSWVGVNSNSGQLTSNQSQSLTISNVNFIPSNSTAYFMINSNGGNQQLTVTYNQSTISKLVLTNITPSDVQVKDYGEFAVYTIQAKYDNGTVASGATIMVSDEISGKTTETTITNSSGIAQFQTSAVPNSVTNGTIFDITFKAKKQGSDNSETVIRQIKVEHVNSNVRRIILSDTIITFTSQINSTIPNAQSDILTITGTGSAVWQITGKPTWLDVNPISGTSSSGTISLQPNTTNLSTNNSPYDVFLEVQCTGVVNSPQTLHVRYFVNNTTSNQITIGNIKINANSFQSQGGTIQRASGNVNINNIIWFSGNIDVETDPIQPSITGTGEIFVPVSGVPLINKVTLYSGSFTFKVDVAGILKNFIYTNVEDMLKLAGIDAKIENIQVAQDQLTIEGELKFQKIFGINTTIKTIIIRKDSPPCISGKFTINKVDLFPGIILKTLQVQFDCQKNSFVVDAFVSTPAIGVGCMLGMTNGFLDSLAIRATGDVYIGTTGLKLKALTGGVYGLTSPPIEFRLKAYITTDDPVTSTIIQLQDLGLKYTMPSTITGTGNLTLFEKYSLAEAYITLDYPSFLKFGGQVNLADIFVGDAMLNINFHPIWEVNGSLNGDIQVPDGNGFPWDILKSFPFDFNFPFKLASTEDQFKNFLAWGKTSFSIWPINIEIDYSMDFEPCLHNKPPLFNFGTNGNNINPIIYGNAITYNKAKNDKNRYEGLGLPVSVKNPNKYLKLTNQSLSQTVPINEDYSKLILRITGQDGLPITALTNPDNMKFTPNDTLAIATNRMAYAQNISTNKVFWIIDKPKTGNWKIDISDGKIDTIDVITEISSPAIEVNNVTINQSNLTVEWVNSVVDTSAYVNLYIDNNNIGLDGKLFKKDLKPMSGFNTYTWDWQADSIQPGDYYIYASIIRGSNSPLYSYYKNKITLTSQLKGPENLVATQPNDSTIELNWLANQAVDGYKIGYWDIGDPTRKSYLSSRDTNSISITTIPPGRQYQFSISAFDSLNNLSQQSISNILDFYSSSNNNVPILRFTGYDSLHAYLWNQLKLELPAIDHDGDNLLYTLVESPNNMNISSGGTLNWNPDLNSTKPQSVKLRVSDSKGGVDTLNLKINMRQMAPPIIRLDRTTYDKLDGLLIMVTDVAANTHDRQIDNITVNLILRNDSVNASYTNKLNETVSDLGFVKSQTVSDFNMTVICSETKANSGIFIGHLDRFTSVNDNNGNIKPLSYELFQNYPNPFNNSTIIKYNISSPSKVKIEIFDILGQLVTTLINEYENAGSYKITWNGRNNNYRIVSSGAYIYRFTANDYVVSKKLMLLK